MAIAQTRLDQIRDLVNQWELLVGFTVSVPDWNVTDMAGQSNIQSLFDVGNYFRFSYGGGAWPFAKDVAAKMPWALYGMSSAEYATKAEAIDTTFQQLTGQNVPASLLDQALVQRQGVMSGPQFQTWLTSQQSILNTYGWLKYGLDFQQFQQQKLQMQTSFGRDLSDQEAVTQLQYLHTAQGSNQSASQQPTLGQVEKKQANVGPAQSVVR